MGLDPTSTPRLPRRTVLIGVAVATAAVLVAAALIANWDDDEGVSAPPDPRVQAVGGPPFRDIAAPAVSEAPNSVAARSGSAYLIATSGQEGTDGPFRVIAWASVERGANGLTACAEVEPEGVGWPGTRCATVDATRGQPLTTQGWARGEKGPAFLWGVARDPVRAVAFIDAVGVRHVTPAIRIPGSDTRVFVLETRDPTRAVPPLQALAESGEEVRPN